MIPHPLIKNQRRNNTEDIFYLKFAICIVVGVILVTVTQLSIFKSAEYEIDFPLDLIQTSGCHGNACNSPKEETIRIHKHLENTVSVTTKKKSSKKKKFVTLMLANPQNAKNLTRALDQLVKFTRGSDLPIAVSLRRENPKYLEILARYPVHVIKSTIKSESNFVVDTSLNAINDAISKSFNFLGNFMSGGLWSPDSCPSTLGVSDGHINVMDVEEKYRKIYKYNFTGALTSDQNSVTFGTWAYNPNMQKLQKANNKRYGEDISGNRCSSSSYVKNSFKLLLEHYENYENFIIVDDQKVFSSNLLGFFTHTSEIFDLDPSVYCVSASNPLDVPQSRADPTRLMRVDHFEGGGAVMIPNKVIKEIVQRYSEPFYDLDQNYPFESNSYDDPLNDLSYWLSWFRNRKLRGCIVPATPRVCPLGIECNKNSIPETQFNMKRLIKYKYSIEFLSYLEAVEPLDYDQLPCNSDVQLKPKNSSLDMSIYIKMDGHDDDLTLHCILLCFGIDHHVPKGSFNNVYTVYWRGQRIFILGIPYSRYGPTIVKGAPLLMVLIETLTSASMTKILKTRDFETPRMCNVSHIPYAIGDEKAIEEFKSNKTSA